MPSAAQLAGLLWTAIYRPNDMKAIITYKVRRALALVTHTSATAPLTLTLRAALARPAQPHREQPRVRLVSRRSPAHASSAHSTAFSASTS